MSLLCEYDEAIRNEGYSLLCGVDEAGRGPLAGAVYAATVIFRPDDIPEGLNDSKKLTPKRREVLFEQITTQALACSIATASVGEIDECNILQASLLAMRRAVQNLSVCPELLLVDGSYDPQAGIAARPVIKGDGLSASIAAASILAKTARDRYMLELDKKYPQYQFAKHKGYPTKLHYEMLDLYGECPVHRKTFLKKWKAARGV